MSNRSPVDQLLPLVVRSNASSQNSWPAFLLKRLLGAFFWALVTVVHGAGVADGQVGEVLPVWPICRVSTAWAIVSSRGGV